VWDVTVWDGDRCQQLNRGSIPYSGQSGKCQTGGPSGSFIVNCEAAGKISAAVAVDHTLAPLSLLIVAAVFVAAQRQ